MTGAIIGDIVGSVYEFRNTKDYGFKMFPKGASYTDDSICTIAVADAILRGVPYRDSLVEWCRKYPHPKGAYGGSFVKWIHSEDPQPYGSYGNGSAMRVAAVGWAFDESSLVMEEAKRSAECSHSHEEGIKGAQAIALAIHHLAHLQGGKDDVLAICRRFYGEDYEARLPKAGQWNETCQGCVPLALHLFLQSDSFEDALRKAVSYGGDSDTMGAIVGSVAEAYYGISKDMLDVALSYLPQDMLDVVQRFVDLYVRKG
ncbi:MAG: ADP-ribosylglycohydrolase family protein [Paludibacteraceae bacterium]|nr:ADP-ribosylglycohydrolase family protein [Paludibacteraceae bacterium]MBP5481468.1 ADP-ribosylglycohydrolase family protein [Paludibacteraceae bacterium]